MYLSKDKNMSINYPYYLPLHASMYESIRFIAITPRLDGYGETQAQKLDKAGTPMWSVTALVRLPGKQSETEVFSLTAPKEVATKLNTIEELTEIRLHGLAGGKYVKTGTDKTEWSFQITGVDLVKN
jgi:hypothetical protein